MYSDCGSKLVAAEKELRDAFQGFFKTICLSMEMIKLSKKIAVGEQTLSFLELQTVRLYIETCFRKEHMGGMQVAPNKANTLSPSTCYKVILFLPFV